MRSQLKILRAVVAAALLATGLASAAAANQWVPRAQAAANASFFHARALSQGGGAVSGASQPNLTNFPPVLTPSCPGSLWGDSLSAGSGGTTATPTIVLANDTNCRWYNEGIGGQISTQIAQRQGGVAFTVTLTSAPLTGSANQAITNINGAAIAACNATCTGQPLSTSSNDATSTLTGTLCTYHGVLTRTASGGPPSTSETYTFTPDNASASNACSGAQTFTVDSSQFWPYPQVFWAGINNVTAVSTVEADNASMVATATNANYAVLSILTADYNPAGSSAYNNMLSINASFATSYGTQYLDVRNWLIANHSLSNIVDLYQVAQGLGVTPYTLHAVAGTGTLSGSINNSTCAITLSSTVDQGGVVFIDSEYILATTVSGSVISACTRGYAGSTAASHTNGAAYTASDPIHLNNTGYTLVGNYVAQHAPFSTNVATQGVSGKTLVTSFVPPGDPTSLGMGAGALASFQQLVAGSSLAIGQNALNVWTGQGQTNVCCNTAIGPSALAQLTTGKNNTALGYLALNAELTGSNNAAFGDEAGHLTTSSNNTFLGYFAGQAVTSGGSNVAVGYLSLNAANGGNSTAIGNDALTSSVGSDNTAVGSNAGNHLTNGGSNTIVGYNCGSATITNGGSNILIGNAASGAGGCDVVSSNDNSHLIIGNILFRSLISAAAPTVSSCGTETIETHSNNSTGQVNITGGSPAACTITFAGTTPYATWVHCVVTAESGETGSVNIGFNYSYTTGAITLGATALSGEFDYSCEGY